DDLTGPEQLDGMIRPPHEAGAEQRLRRHLDALREQHEMAHIHDLRRLLERIGEAALGNPADQRHLPALEPRTHLAALARRLTLAAATGRLADTRPGAATLADARAVRAARCLQVVQCQPLDLALGVRGSGLGPRPRLPCRFRFSSWHLTSFLWPEAFARSSLPPSPRRDGAPAAACRAPRGDPRERLQPDGA